MTFTSGLKRICDICFYLTFASLIGSLIGADNLVSTLPLFVCIAFLSAFFAQKGKVKYFSFLLYPLIFLLISPTTPNLIILIPAMLYLIKACPKQKERASEFDYATVFMVFLGIFGFIFVFNLLINSWVAGSMPEFASDFFLFALMFAILSIVFMRMARHNDSVLKQFRFKVMNAASLIGVIVAAVLVSSNVFLAFIWSIIRFIWVRLIMPLLEAVIWVIFNILAFFMRILGTDHSMDGLMEILGDDGSPEAAVEEIFYYEHEVWPYGRIILVVILAIIGIFVLIKIFKLLTSKIAVTEIDTEGIVEERFALDDDKQQRKRRFGRQKENQVREIYRDFLRLIKKNEVLVPSFLTSHEIDVQVSGKFQSKKSSQIRDEYIKIRYGKADFTKDDINRVKGLYKEFKEEIDQFSKE